jgi:transglutaminase-like putative cysteine protease
MIQMNWWKSQNKFLKSIVLSIGFVAFSNAQNSVNDYKTQFPDANEIVVNDNQIYTITIENNKLKVIQDNHFESMILTENGIQNNQESFTYSDLVKLKDYEAYTIFSNNGKDKKIKVTQINEKNSSSNAVFFDDVKEKQLIFPNLETGASKVYDFQVQFMDPFLLQKFIFGGGFPVKNASLEVKTEKDINIGFKIFNDPNHTISYSKTEKKGKWVYNWTLANIKPIKREDHSPGYLHIIPHIIFYIKDYKINDKPVEVLGTVDNLYNYYKGFIKSLNQSENPELKALTLKITEESKTDEEKVKTIFYWVKENIKYIAFENGYEGFIPREASLIYDRKFGDCKDMASIISCMAKYAGVKNVSVAWVGTRRIPYSYNEIATPAVDDHMIAVFKNGTDYIFLDATDKTTRYGIPTGFIQGKEALFNDGDSYKILPIPIVPAEVNEVNETVKLVIDKDKLIGSGTTEFNGYVRSELLMNIGDAINKSRFEMIKPLVIKGNNKFSLKDYSEENVKDIDKPYKINYNFDIDNYIIRVDKDIYINMFLNKDAEKMNMEKDRVAKFDFEALMYSHGIYELKIPENYVVKYMPKDFSIDNNLTTLNFLFEVKNNTLYFKYDMKVKKLVLETTDFELWNEVTKKIKSKFTETIILSQK